MNESILVYVIVGFILLVCLKVYSESDVYNLKCIISGIDGHKYCVRDRERINEAADLLAQVTGKCNELVGYVKEKHPNHEGVKRLVAGFNPKKISETLPNSELTAYSENKGEKLAFCLNRTKNSTTLIDINTLTFVAIHELSHIMTTTVGHNMDFWQNFKFLLENAKDAKIYNPIDYKKNPQSYCGMMITDSPLYNL
jgi:hypothetical protein